MNTHNTSTYNDHTSLYQSKYYQTFCSEKNQDVAANDVVSRILKNCTGAYHFPKVSTLVDLGCGDGILLSRIVKLNEACNGKKFTAYGIDFVDPNVVSGHKEPKSNFTYIKANLNDKPFNEIPELSGVSWDETAILCLCHTWFYFTEDYVRRAIENVRPAMILIGVYHTWDVAIGKLNSENPYHEPRALTTTLAAFTVFGLSGLTAVRRLSNGAYLSENPALRKIVGNSKRGRLHRQATIYSAMIFRKRAIPTKKTIGCRPVKMLPKAEY